MSGRTKAGLRFDPRTSLLLLLLTVLGAMMAPSLTYELGLVTLVALLALLCGEWRKAALGFAAYIIFYLLTLAVMRMDASPLETTLIAFLGLLHKVYPCGFFASVVIATTKVSEFLSTMNRIHAPKKLVIPFAVMLRYLPAIREDWHFIKDAMRLRDVSPNFAGLLTHPVRTVECVYVPLMMAASKAADELSIASVTRGIENPRPRTCLVQIRFRTADMLALICFAAYFASGLLWKKAFL